VLSPERILSPRRPWAALWLLLLGLLSSGPGHLALHAWFDSHAEGHVHGVCGGHERAPQQGTCPDELGDDGDLAVSATTQADVHGDDHCPLCGQVAAGEQAAQALRGRPGDPRAPPPCLDRGPRESGPIRAHGARGPPATA
jgi:hypothetical protein